MLRILSKKEEQEHRQKLRKFIKDNHCDMYNIMKDIEGFRYQGKNQERVRIIRIIGKLKIDKKIKEKVIDGIMEEDKKKMEERMKKYGASRVD